MNTHVVPRILPAPWFARQARRAVRLVWWTVTLQLHRRFREWRRARSARRLAPKPPDGAPELIRTVDPAQLHLPRDPRPKVSIIIPTYGQVDYTLCCLASIAAHPSRATIEVIVVDDATPDPSTSCLAGVSGIRLIVNRRNLGYLRTCNAAARVARGEFLLFLNNDTQVREGWLDPLLAPFATSDDVGAVGAKLLYPDGTLQEAGCIVWDDGSAWNYGRFDDPERSVYNYVREVDYCSAACLLVPRALFHRAGGFDERYAPAYCEDSDLAFRLRELGYKVLYQPRCHIVHFEGISHGKTLTGCIKSYQVRNQRKFQERWQSVLSREHLPNGRHVMRARDRARHRPVILVIDHYVPEPDRDAGSRTMLCIIQSLVRAGLVVKFWPANLHYSPGYTKALQDIGVEVAYGSCSFQQWLQVNANELDYVLLSRPQVAAEFLPEVKRYGAIGLLYYGHDLHFDRMRKQAELSDDAGIMRQADAMEALERSIWREVDVVLYPSAEEVAKVVARPSTCFVHAVKDDVGGRAKPGHDDWVRTLVPYWFAAFAPPRAPVAEPRILFVAGFAHPPNRDAARWFVQQVWPLVLARVPDARLAIVGSNPPPDVQALAGGAITVRANVTEAELSVHYRSARVAVVPLRYGAGVKLKVVEALREGLPLVTTSIGAQGLPGLDAVVSVCDEPQAFADEVCHLLTDGIMWAERSVAQVDYAATHFSEAVFRDTLLAALAQSASRCSARLAS